MKTVLITGSSGLVGSESTHFFCQQGYQVVGIDNNMRQFFFGKEASTEWMTEKLVQSYPNFKNEFLDIRDYAALEKVFKTYSSSIDLIIHCAAQPSHDWAAKEPFTDFSVNANGTLNLLEAARLYCPQAVFIFMSTNKVYGDAPNRLPLIELETRWEIDPNYAKYQDGIDENFSIDQSKHSLFGASKVAADILVQEYGRYFGMKTGVFRGGCLTGPNHSGAELHGFLSYLMICCLTGKEYRIFGYKGKQVRDNIHSSDLVQAFFEFYKNPKSGAVYNMGGSRVSNCSMLEAIQISEKLSGKKMKSIYLETNRIGDHIWWISDVSRFKADYSNWSIQKNINDILGEMFEFYAKQKL